MNKTIAKRKSALLKIVLGVGILLAGLILWDISIWPLARELVILPNTEVDIHVFRSEVFNGLIPYSGGAQDRILPASEAVLDKGETAVRAFGIVNLSRSGTYKLVLSNQGKATVFIDGRFMLGNSNYQRTASPTVGEVHLSAGKHFLVFEVHKPRGGGRLRLEVHGQGLEGVLHGGELAAVDLANINTWWGLIRAARNPAVLAVLMALLALLLIPRSAYQSGWVRAAASIKDRPHLWVRTTLLALIVAAIQGPMFPRPYLDGDEPHYLMTTASIIHDLDFNIYNDYQERRFLGFGYHYERLRPQVGEWDKFMPPEHGVGFPLLIALPYQLFGVLGVRLFLIALGFLAAIFTALLCDQIGLDHKAGTLAGAVLCLSPSWQFHADAVFPEVTAGLLVVLFLYLGERYQDRAGRHWPTPLALGAMATWFPLLYPKYMVFGIALGLYCLLRRPLRSRPSLYLGAALMAVIAALSWLAIYGTGLEMFASGGTANFAVSGSFQRIWPSWFDATHGLLVLQPFFILIFLAAPVVVIRRWPQPWALCGALALAFYVILHGLWVGNPGQSWPGRYLCAGMPLMCVFITAWCFGGTRGRVWRRWLFLLLALPGALFSAGIVWRGWFDINNVNADFTPNFYHQLFLPFWRATQSQFPHGGELIGYLVVAAAVLGLGFEIRAWLAEKRS